MPTKSGNLVRTIKLLRWILPIAFAIVSTLYQLVLSRHVSQVYGHEIHWWVEILFYSTAGPLLSFWVITRIGQWLEEKDHLEKEARTSETRLASITNASADAILGIDKQGCIESWNRGADLLFGYLPEEIIGRPLSVLFEGGLGALEEIRWLHETVRRDGFVRGHETHCQTANGQIIFVELTATYLSTDATRNGGGMSLILRDITNRKRREEEIRRLNESLNQQVSERTRQLAEKIDQLASANEQLQKLDQMRSEFVSLVSHQIRAPLTNISGAIQRIRDHPEESPPDPRLLGIIDQQTSRLDRLVQDVLNAAQIETGKLALHPEPISMLPLVQQVMDQVCARRITRPVELLEKPGLPMAYADRDRVTEVLTNLLDNADKYSPEGETITLELRAALEEITLSIRDRGPGIPIQALERVFDKFYRTDSSDSQAAYGYGLGLYVCRMLIETQGGKIWAENHPQGGAVFSFTLPAWQESHG